MLAKLNREQTPDYPRISDNAPRYNLFARWIAGIKIEIE